MLNKFLAYDTLVLYSHSVIIFLMSNILFYICCMSVKKKKHLRRLLCGYYTFYTYNYTFNFYYINVLQTHRTYTLEMSLCIYGWLSWGSDISSSFFYIFFFCSTLKRINGREDERYNTNSSNLLLLSPGNQAENIQIVWLLYDANKDFSTHLLWNNQTVSQMKWK